MYNRYIREQDGSYTRITQNPPIGTPPPHKDLRQEEAPPRENIPASEVPPQDEAPNFEAAREGGKFLDRILEKLHIEDIDSADMMLLALLFFLYEEKADDELLIALGLLLIL